MFVPSHHFDDLGPQVMIDTFSLILLVQIYYRQYIQKDPKNIICVTKNTTNVRTAAVLIYC